jgi:hypothetical protein
MNQKEKIQRSISLIHELTDLIEGNEYQLYLCSRLISVQFELQRQLTNLSSYSKIKE